MVYKKTRRRPTEHVRKVNTRQGKRVVVVNPGRRKKVVRKRMVWEEPKKLQYFEYMTPDEYLSKTLNRPERYKPETYFDIETKKEEPIQRLVDYIKSKDVKVELPHVDVDQDNIFGRSEHEGRHRVFAAKKAGEDLVKVLVPPPNSWRTDDIKEEFVKRLTVNRSFPDEESDNRLKSVIDSPFPYDRMGLRERKVYQEILENKGLLEKS